MLASLCRTRTCSFEEVVRVILTEGSLSAVSCTTQGPAACSRSECCHTKPMWDKLDQLIDAFFEDITIADLLKNET